MGAKAENLIQSLIEAYESNEDSSIDDILSYTAIKPRQKGISMENYIEIKRRFWEYVDSVEKSESYARIFEELNGESVLFPFTSQSVQSIDGAFLSKTFPYQRRRFPTHKKYVEAFVNNVSVPKTLEELNRYFMDGNDAQELVKSILFDGSTTWTVPRWAKRVDIVLFMHSKTANSTLTRLRSEVRRLYSPNDKIAIAFEKTIAEQLAFHKIYGGKILAVGRVNGKPETLSVDSSIHSKSHIFCYIDHLFLLQNPVDISEFNSFIKISRLSGITPVFGYPYDRLKEIIIGKNRVEKYFTYSYSTPFPHSLVNEKTGRSWVRNTDIHLHWKSSFGSVMSIIYYKQ